MFVAAALLAAGFIAGFGLARRRAARQFRQLAALIHGLREGDYTLRSIRRPGAIGEAFTAVDILADRLKGDRAAGIESDALLGKLLGAVNLAILVMGPGGRLIGGNAKAAGMLGMSGEDFIGRRPDELGIGAWIQIKAATRFETRLPGGHGPWDVRTVRFRRHGREHLLLVATDLSQALREEERRVWRGLIRVLSHETGNSLGPIQATAEALADGLCKMDSQDVLQGLALIERRARSLASFIRRYAELARLPPPVLQPANLAELLRRVVALETRLPVAQTIIEDVSLCLDAGQIEQALINLLRNATDAALEGGHQVALRMVSAKSAVTIEILDNGPGLPDSRNMFVPGFTTKPGGSGVGLVLAREIIEGHGGRLSLMDRSDSPGALALVEFFQPAPGLAQ